LFLKPKDSTNLDLIAVESTLAVIDKKKRLDVNILHRTQTVFAGRFTRFTSSKTHFYLFMDYYRTKSSRSF
jgi:hypothetical protein